MADRRIPGIGRARGPALALALAAAASAPAQDLSDDALEFAPQPVLGGGTAVYSAGDRRDPFVPLNTTTETDEGGVEGPRFESMSLTGVFLGGQGNSLIVLEDPAKRGHFVRLGERVGAARLVEIRPRAAVFEIVEYGAARRVVLELRNAPNQGRAGTRIPPVTPPTAPAPAPQQAPTQETP